MTLNRMLYSISQLTEQRNSQMVCCLISDRFINAVMMAHASGIEVVGIL